MVDVDYPFELPLEPLDGASLDEAKFAELPEVLQAAVENFRRATYELLVKNGLGLPGPDILTTLRTDYRLDARKLYEALNTLTIDRLMNQPVMRRHFRLATIDWFGEKKPVWKAVPTDENRVIIEKNAAAVIERERNKRQARKQHVEMLARRMIQPERRPLQMNNRGPPRRAGGPPSRHWPSTAVPGHSAATRAARTSTNRTSVAQPGPSRTFWIVVYAWIWMLIRSWALTAAIGLAVFWEESRPDEVDDEEHKFEVKLCLSLAFWTIMFITSVTEVTNINCVRSSTFYLANAALEFLALIVFAVSFAYHIYVLPADQYQQKYSDDDIFISGRLLSVVGVAILLLIATLPYPVLLLNVYRSKDRFESTDPNRRAIR